MANEHLSSSVFLGVMRLPRSSYSEMDVEDACDRDSLACRAWEEEEVKMFKTRGLQGGLSSGSRMKGHSVHPVP